MVRESLVEQATRRLLDRVTSGEFPAGAALPPEGVLAEQSEVSRLTIREAVKVLASQQILRKVQGRGTYVNPSDRWTSLEALIRMQHGDAATAIVQLVEVRTMIEIGAAELFAARGSESDLAEMRSDLGRMRTAHRDRDIEAFAQADIAFHNRILEGCGNPFVPATFSPIAHALRDARTRTSSIGVIREHAIDEHEKIIEALATGSSDAASAAMRSHLAQTRDDAREHLTARQER